MVDELEKIMEKMQDGDRAKALVKSEHFQWYLEKLKDTRISLSERLSKGLDLTAEQIRLIQTEIKVIDRLILNPFIWIYQADLYEELEEEEEGITEPEKETS